MCVLSSAGNDQFWTKSVEEMFVSPNIWHKLWGKLMMVTCISLWWRWCSYWWRFVYSSKLISVVMSIGWLWQWSRSWGPEYWLVWEPRGVRTGHQTQPLTINIWVGHVNTALGGYSLITHMKRQCICLYYIVVSPSRSPAMLLTCIHASWERSKTFMSTLLKLKTNTLWIDKQFTCWLSQDLLLGKHARQSDMRWWILLITSSLLLPSCFMPV